MLDITKKGNWSTKEKLAGRPREDITVTQWAEHRRVLTNAAIRGPYQSRHVPALVPVMDWITRPEVETIVLCKSAQIGGTDAMLNILGYYIDQEPSSIMLVLADEDTAIQEMSRRRVQPMFTDSPQLRHLPDKDNWLKSELSFINGSRLTFGWASSVARLASRPFRIVCCDEIDKAGYEIATREGDAVGLAKERTNTFANRKIMLLSTPTVPTGRITRELASCDVIFDWHVPCPYCGQFQPLRWSEKYASDCKDGKYRGDDGKLHRVGCVVWDGGRNATRLQLDGARYQCGECEKHWTTVQKNAAIQEGKMVPRSEYLGHERKIGFHINRLYSLFPGGRIETMVSDWTAAVKSADVTQVQGFINSSLAEPFSQVTVAASANEVLKACVDLSPRTIPEGTKVLTCGIDNQKNGFWYVVRAWAEGYVSWLVDYGFMAAWDDVERLLFETVYPDKDGANYAIWRAAIDTGGGAGVDGGLSMTEEVYFWLRRNGVGRGCRVWGTKGSSHALRQKIKAGAPLDKTPSGKPLPGGLVVVSLNTDVLKDVYHYRLNQALTKEESQSAYLHKDVGEDYAKQIQAEQKQIDRKGKEEWVQVRRDNHLLDCEVICHALVDPEWPGGGINLLRRKQIKTEASNVKKKMAAKGREQRYPGHRQRW